MAPTLPITCKYLAEESMDAKTETDRHAEFKGRVEDEPLVRGRGRYIADAPLPNQAYAYFVRSPHAFARIVSVDVSGALRAPGVVGVLTGKDTAETGSIGRHPPVPGRGGTTLFMPHRPALATERVMHIGEPIAMVVAETAAAAQDAAEIRHRGVRGTHAGDRRAQGAARRRDAIVAASGRQHRGRLAWAKPQSRSQQQIGG